MPLLSRQLQVTGLRVFHRSWEVSAGAHLVGEIDAAIRQAHLTIAVVSPAYYGSKHSAEWQAAFTADRAWLGERLLPVRVADHPLDGLVAHLFSVDLFDVDAPVARDRLVAPAERTLAGARASRARPAQLPAGARTPRAPAGFPGRAWLRGIPVTEPLPNPYLNAVEDDGPLAAIRARDGVVPFQPRSELDVRQSRCSYTPASGRASPDLSCLDRV
ncbi:toll/interleukin-1 receptor domain-containing protein [Frankia tisae]|uniref:toll/interleukin-1 receptor domain-containing protein n=1 Tax=Frankia tisae TaxID=2950104 RepID=UPI0021C1AB72|nr:toll/interleukin-1 receptor domain-containing protein [Frankia tisae]